MMAGQSSACWVLVPVKAFSRAKLRLASVLSAGERKELAIAMATTVVEAARPMPIAVVCDDAEVATWAEGLGVAVIWSPGGDLSTAVQDGVTHLASAGVSYALIVHADLPHAREIGPLTGWNGVTLVPDRHLDGTNAICIPTASDFRFSFGAGSFRAHVAEASRRGLPLRIVRDQLLGWDIDLPPDLEAIEGTMFLAPRCQLRAGRRIARNVD